VRERGREGEGGERESVEVKLAPKN